MYVWYVSKHKHNIILGVFGNVFGAFGSVWERVGGVWRRLATFRSVVERLETA